MKYKLLDQLSHQEICLARRTERKVKIENSGIVTAFLEIKPRGLPERNAIALNITCTTCREAADLVGPTNDFFLDFLELSYQGHQTPFFSQICWKEQIIS